MSKSLSSDVKAIKSGVWYTISNFFVKGLGFITTPIFTRMLTQSEFGDYNNYISWMSIFGIFVTLNLESTLISAKYDFKENFDKYILSMISMSTLSGVIWIFLVNCFPEIFQNMFDMDLCYINIMLGYLLFLPCVNMFLAREQYAFEYKKSVLLSQILVIGTTLCSVVLVFIMENRLTGRILGSVVPTCIIGIFIFTFFIIKGKKLDVSYWRYAINICLPYIPHLLSLTILNSTDRIMIKKWCGDVDVALYSLAYTCGAMITILMTSLNNAFAPWLGEKIAKLKYFEIKQFSKVYVSLFFFLAIGIMIISPEILLLLGGESYQEAVYVLAPVIMGCICQFIYSMFVNAEQFKKKTVGMAIASAVAAVLNLILNYLFIPRFGYIAAAYTTLISYFVLLVIHMYLVYILHLSEIYDYKFILKIIALGFLITIIVSLLYSFMILRYILGGIYYVVIIAILYKNKKKILPLVKKEY